MFTREHCETCARYYTDLLRICSLHGRRCVQHSTAVKVWRRPTAFHPARHWCILPCMRDIVPTPLLQRYSCRIWEGSCHDRTTWQRRQISFSCFHRYGVGRSHGELQDRSDHMIPVPKLLLPTHSGWPHVPGSSMNLLITLCLRRPGYICRPVGYSARLFPGMKALCLS